MKSAMMTRPTMGGSAMMAGMGGSTMSSQATMPMQFGAMMIPQCTVKLEKCTDGMKIHCTCDDEVACATLQNLCQMMAGGMCSCCCVMNGMCLCQCNMSVAMCKCENTKMGVCITCTSGDTACCKMIQACCDCVCQMMAAGCMCCVCFNDTPVCCGTC